MTVTPIRRKKRLIIEVSALTVRLGQKAIAKRLKRDVRLLAARSFEKITVRHQLGSPVAAMPDRLSRAVPFNPLKPFDRHRFADLVAARARGGSFSPAPPHRSRGHASLANMAWASLLASAQPTG